MIASKVLAAFDVAVLKFSELKKDKCKMPCFIVADKIFANIKRASIAFIRNYIFRINVLAGMYAIVP